MTADKAADIATSSPIQSGPVTEKERHLVLDLLRGLALMGIALANYPEFSLWTFLGSEAQQAMPTAGVDRVVRFLQYLLVDGKFYSIFSILFGIGFALILVRHGRRLFVRRMLLLAVIGFVHLMFIWSGDILLLYAIGGLLLTLFVGISDRHLLYVAVGFILLPVGLDALTEFCGADFAGPFYDAWWRAASARGINEDNFASWLRDADSYGQMFDFLVQGACERMWEIVEGHRLPKVLGLFILGYLCGKQRFYARLYELPLQKVFRRTLLIGLSTSLPYAWSATNGHPWGITVHSALYAVSVIPLAIAFMSGVCLFYLRHQEWPLFRWLAAPGRMALTNYISHSLFGVLLFYGLGLGLGTTFGLVHSELTALGVFVLQIVCSILWLRWFRFGPLEWVWRMLTYKRYFPLMKSVLLLFIVCAATKAQADAPATTDTISPTGTIVPTDSTKSTVAKWSVQLSGNVSHMFHAGPYNKEILHSYGTSFYDARLKWQSGKGSARIEGAEPSGWQPSPYDEAMGFPTLQVGLLCADYSRVQVYRESTPYHSRIGRIWTLFGGLQLDFLRKGPFCVGIDLQHGIGYCEHPFDEATNIDNEVIGSPLSIYIGGGIYAKYCVAPRWSLSLGADFKHFSNGTLDRPNIGANTLGGTLALHYEFGHTSVASARAQQEARRASSAEFNAPNAKQGFYVDVVVGLGMKALNDHFTIFHTKDNPVYGFFTTMVAPMYRWHLLHATGLGFDYSYADYVFKLRQYDQQRQLSGYTYSPHIMGVSLRHEVFYHCFSLNVGVGVYAKKQTGHTGATNDSRCYQSVGLRYSPPFVRHRFFLGYNVKAHYFSRVDCVQLIVGCRIG